MSDRDTVLAMADALGGRREDKLVEMILALRDVYFEDVSHGHRRIVPSSSETEVKPAWLNPLLAPGDR